MTALFLIAVAVLVVVGFIAEVSERRAKVEQ